MQLEDPRLTKLHEAIVVQGDYELTENLIESAIQGTRRDVVSNFVTKNFTHAHRCKKNYKHLRFAIVVAFWLNTLHWLA